MQSDLLWIAVNPEDLCGLEQARHLAVSSYSRLLLPKITPESVEKLLYIDIDVLVLSDIYTPFSCIDWKYELYAVPDFRFSDSDFMLSLGAHPDTLGMNAGILALDITNLRKSGDFEKALEFARQYRKLDFADQDALNAVLQGKWGRLDWKWNLYQCNPADLLPETLDGANRPKNWNDMYSQAYILHFVSPSKPWNCASKHPASTVYHQYIQECGFFSALEYRQWLRSYRKLLRKQFVHRIQRKLEKLFSATSTLRK